MTQHQVVQPVQQEESPIKTLLRGIADWFTSKLSGQDVKTVHIQDKPIRAIARGDLGSLALAEYEGLDITIDFNEAAQNARAEADKIVAEGRQEAEKAKGQGEADAARIRAKAEAARIRRGG